MKRQSATGLILAALLILAWASLQLVGAGLRGAGLAAAILIVPLICWLDVGLFILAHDAMHGSLAPGRPWLNRLVGRLALGLYAGFSFDRLLPKHLAHHRAPGTADDPDFHAADPRAFFAWYFAFLRQYFGLRELAVIALVVLLYWFLLGPLPNFLLFWALPAILSSFQLFLFGTWLPHRHRAEDFEDRHRARSNAFGWAASLLSCFHFGYHLEHHRAPHVPWWRLPGERRLS
jgi:beta-carotene ketolase (CrtW type)